MLLCSRQHLLVSVGREVITVEMRVVCLGLFLLFVCFSVRVEAWDYDDEYQDPNLEEGSDQDYIGYEQENSGGSVIFSVWRPFNNEPQSTNDEDPITNEVEQTENIPDVFTPHNNEVTIDDLVAKMDNLISEINAQKDKITELEETNKKLLLKIDLLEQHTKTNTLLFFNVSQGKHETYKSTTQKVLHVMNRIMRVRVKHDDISVALRSESNSSGKNRPIMVRFTNFATKMQVLGAKKRLDDTYIQVTPDYSELVAKKREQMVPFMMEARRQGRNAFLLYDKLVIDGVKKTLEELQAAEAESTEATSVQPDEQVEEIEELLKYVQKHLED